MMKWTVSQLVAREHYAIPRALNRIGLLDLICTDIWANRAVRNFGPMLGSSGRALASRYHTELSEERIKHWAIRTLLRQTVRRVRRTCPYLGFIEDGCWFSSLVRNWVSSRRSPPEIIFSYDTSAFELFEWGKNQGCHLILGQMDPGRFEAEIVANEREIWPGCEPGAGQVPESYHARRAAEWQLADTIIVNSRWSRDALIKQGVPEAKVRVIPLVYESSGRLFKEGIAEKRRGPLKLLFLGQVNLRKGIPYLLEAARMAGSAVEVTIVGPVQISREAVASAPSNVCFTGPVSRNEVTEHYRRADAFVLPTLSDGFAITQLEAMAHGLPVIATPNCGEVVTDGVDGRIVSPREPAALASAIMALAGDPDALVAMSQNALLKSRQFTIARLAKDLLGLLPIVS
jgi:glycosyltransferase involved in cell wall biosynthesis